MVARLVRQRHHVDAAGDVIAKVASRFRQFGFLGRSLSGSECPSGLSHHPVVAGIRDEDIARSIPSPPG
jgi:hypothetical protein